MSTEPVVTVEVTVTETRTYRFPDPDARCSAHGQELCWRCARSNGRCECGAHEETGMHWDTCPGRIR